MTIHEELADFRSGHPGCHAVVFADLSTGMVLAHSTENKTTQEKLDALCDTARKCLNAPFGEALAGAMDADPQGKPQLAWHRDAEGLYCLIRAVHPAAEALCCLVKKDVSIERLSYDARAVLDRIVTEG